MNFYVGGERQIGLLEGATSRVTIGGSGKDIDFQVMSSASNFSMFMDGATGKLGIGASTPENNDALLTIAGNISSSGVIYNNVASGIAHDPLIQSKYSSLINDDKDDDSSSNVDSSDDQGSSSNSWHSNVVRKRVDPVRNPDPITVRILFCKLKKAQNTWIQFFASYKKLKKHESNF